MFIKNLLEAVDNHPNRLTIIHHNDLDGYGFSPLLMLLDECGQQVYLEEFGAPQKAEEYLMYSAHSSDTVFYIHDLGISDNCLEYLDANGYKWFMIDHHAMPTHTPELLGEGNLIVDTEYCATKILHNEIKKYIDSLASIKNTFYLLPEDQQEIIETLYRNDLEYPKFIEDVNKWDTGHWGDWGPYGFDSAITLNLEFNEDPLHRAHNPVLDDLRAPIRWYHGIMRDLAVEFDYGELIDSFADSVAHIQKSLVIKYNEFIYNVKAVKHPKLPDDLNINFAMMGVKEFSLFAKRYLEEHPQCDALATIIWRYKAFSLRTQKDEVDVSAIAAANGGGGHPKAAGFQMESISDFLSEIRYYDFYGNEY